MDKDIQHFILVNYLLYILLSENVNSIPENNRNLGEIYLWDKLINER